MSERRSNHLLADVSHRQYYISLHKKKKKKTLGGINSTKFAFALLLVDFSADAGRPEFSHSGKVIHLLYIDVVLLVMGNHIHAASDAAMCLYVSDLRSGLYLLIKVSLLVLQKHADVSPFAALRNIMVTFRGGVWNEKVTSKRSYVISCLYSRFSYFYAFVSFFFLDFGHWLCKSCSSLISVGLFFGICKQARSCTLLLRCRICNASWDKTAGLGKQRAVPHRDCRAPLKILWTWGEIVIRMDNEARDFKLGTDRKWIGAKRMGISELLTWRDIKNCLDACSFLPLWSQELLK